jgi:hypothetical protein
MIAWRSPALSDHFRRPFGFRFSDLIWDLALGICDLELKASMT